MNRRERIVLWVFLGIITLLVGIYQAVINHVSTMGETLLKLQKERAVLEKENNTLYIELLSRESLTSINEKAGKEGFVQGKAVGL